MSFSEDFDWEDFDILDHTQNSKLSFLLKYLPRFMDKREGSNINKLLYPIGRVLQILEDDYTIVDFSKDINRPIKIWREQEVPYSYDIEVRVNMPDIKSVKVYRTYPDLAETNLSSIDFEKGINSHEETFSENSDSIIPIERYRVEVENYNGLVLEKGFPEHNDIEVISLLTENQSFIRTLDGGEFFAWSSGGHHTLSLDTDSYEGEYCLRMDMTGDEDYAVFGVELFSVSPNQVYHAISKVKGVAPNRYTQLAIGFYDSSFTWISNVITPAIPVPEDYTTMRVSALAPDNAAYAHINFGLLNYPILDDTLSIDCIFFSNEFIDNELYEEMISQHSIIGEIDSGNIYLHDSALDRFGERYNIDRRKFKENILSEDYSNTLPPYCIDTTEWDYQYESRMITHFRELHTHQIVELELFKYYNLYPEIKGKWRDVARMNKDVMNSPLPQDIKLMGTNHRKYIEDNEEIDYNSATFDIICDVSKVPTNIDMPIGDTVKDIIQRVFPLSKKAYFSLIINGLINPTYNYLTDKLGGYKLQYPSSGYGLYDKFTIDLTIISGSKEGFNLGEKIILTLNREVLTQYGDLVISGSYGGSNMLSDKGEAILGLCEDTLLITERGHHLI